MKIKMKIQGTITTSSNKNNNYIFTSDKNSLTQSHFISFGGKDEFVKVADYTIGITSGYLKERFHKLLEEVNFEKVYSNTLEEIEAICERNKKLAKISEEYQIIDNLLDGSSQNNLTQDAQIVANYLEAMDNISKDKGFGRISGYDDIKNKLKNEFILKIMMMARTSQIIDVPNALIVFGPNSCGKTTFARALSEQTMSNVKVIDATHMPEEKTMDEIFKVLQKSKKDYIESGSKKQRTFLVVNEAEVLAEPKSPVLAKLKKVIKNCSQKYKCTLFLTSNHPLIFDSEILSPNLTPIKIGMPPADKKNCKEIIDNMLIMARKFPQEGTERLVEAFYKNSDRFYSNGNIISVINNTLRDFSNPSVKDFIKVLERNDIRPSITKKSLDEFYETQKYLQDYPIA